MEEKIEQNHGVAREWLGRSSTKDDSNGNRVDAQVGIIIIISAVSRRAKIGKNRAVKLYRDKGRSLGGRNKGPFEGSVLGAH